MWGSEKFVHLSTKQKNQWFKLRLWSKTVYLRMEGEDDRWVWISGVNHPKQRTVDRRDEEESAGRLDRVKRCCWDPPWWTVWRRWHWEKTGGWAGDARTEQDYKYQGDGSHWRRCCRARGRPQKEVQGCSEGGCRMLEMQPKQDDMIQISDFTYLL